MSETCILCKNEIGDPTKAIRTDTIGPFCQECVGWVMSFGVFVADCGMLLVEFLKAKGVRWIGPEETK